MLVKICKNTIGKSTEEEIEIVLIVKDYYETHRQQAVIFKNISE